VNSNVTPTFAAVAPICSGATLSALPTTSTNGISGTWSPALNNTATTTYTFTPTAGQCATTTTMTITVNPLPMITGTLTVCLGFTTQLTGSATAAASNPWVSSNTSVATVSNTGLVTGVSAGTSTITYINSNGCQQTAMVTVESQPNAGTDGNTTICDSSVAPINLFSLITGEQSGGTWTRTTGSGGAFNAGLGTFTPALGATTSTFTYTLTGVAPCINDLSVATIQITSAPVLTYTVTNTVCNGSTLDFAFTPSVTGTTYNWSATVSNISGFYNTTTSGNETNINNVVALTNPEVIGTITMVIIPRANGCDGTPQTVIITVNPNPVVEVVAVADTSVCSATSATNNVQVTISGNISGIAYNWTAITSGVTVVGGTTSGTITATSTTASFGLQVITSNPLVAGTISFEVSAVRNGCIGNTLQSAVVTVNPNPGVAISSPDKTICSGDPTNLMIDVSPLIAGTEIEWEVLTVVNVSGANPGSGIAPQPINDILTSTTGGYVIYRVRTSLGDCEGTFTDYRVNVNPAPLPILADGNICITATGQVYQTYTLNTGLNNADYDFEWFDSSGNIIPGETNATLVVDEAGTYSVIATNWLTGCSSDSTLSTATAIVTETMPATTMTVVQREYFSDNATITVNVTGGTGTLMYSLDEGPLQSSNVFTGVSPGVHLVTVIDTEGCTYLTQEVTIIDYPNYFTPNGDGYNDSWYIAGLQDTDFIYIFDRYGKLIKQLRGEESWDGMYNQEQLPSTDYWFTLDYNENGAVKQFKAHFSLKR
jgi:gliding motility-associated-like protein